MKVEVHGSDFPIGLFIRTIIYTFIGGVAIMWVFSPWCPHILWDANFRSNLFLVNSLVLVINAVANPGEYITLDVLPMSEFCLIRHSFIKPLLVPLMVSLLFGTQRVRLPLPSIDVYPTCVLTSSPGYLHGVSQLGQDLVSNIRHWEDTMGPPSFSESQYTKAIASTGHRQHT
jgi:hypothetical protein